MNAEGGDGISRGSLNTGVMGGENMLSFIPLHLLAIESLSTLLGWIRSWTGPDLETLSPGDGFKRDTTLGDGRRLRASPFNTLSSSQDFMGGSLLRPLLTLL
jgi:hypothetical protein